MAQVPSRASVAAIAGRANEIAGECPSVLTDAPHNAAFKEIGKEVSMILFHVGVAPQRAMRLEFARDIAGLSWSNHKLTLLVRAQAAGEAPFVAVALPDVCADIEAWKASGYAVLPQSAKEFLSRVRTIESELRVGPSKEFREAAIMRLLRSYEGPNSRRIAKQVERQEQRTERELGAAIGAVWTRLAIALGVGVPGRLTAVTALLRMALSPSWVDTKLHDAFGEHVAGHRSYR
jgi:hypothetical protein